MTDTTPATPLLDALRTEACRIEEDTQHSAKNQFNTCESWSGLHYWLGIPATLAAAGASAAFVKDWPLAAQLLSMLATVLTALTTFLKANDKAAQHKAIGNQYLTLRNDTRIFREIELLEPGEETKKAEKLRKLAQRRNELNAAAPVPTRSAFQKTRKGIAEGEAEYAVDKKS